MNPNIGYLQFIILFISVRTVLLEYCDSNDKCRQDINKYTKEANDWNRQFKNNIIEAVKKYDPCKSENCTCFIDVIKNDLKPFKDGITNRQFDEACQKATKYQIVDGTLYREEACHFPARCAGVEHYLTALASKLPNIEIALNTRDWPQFNKAWGHKPTPLFSFSKTEDYYDIMYPAWSFWEGGPAISLYPTGIGRWDKHIETISAAAKKWPWEVKKGKAFFRGSRTSEERDPLVLLSRSNPELVDAQYTKNQAWKSKADTLHAEPAKEVSFEDHCKYKYLFNYRGVAASFRLKHLFLCKSLVFHVGDQWLEFFYPSLKPWIHYVPVRSKASKEDIKNIIEFFKKNDDLAKEIAERGFLHIWENLTEESVMCYWENLLLKYSELLKYNVVLDKTLKKIS